MFKWKIYTYSNINWKEKRFEKEFDDPREYEEFISQNSWFSGFLNWKMPFDSLFDFNSYLDNFFNSKFLPSSLQNQRKLTQTTDDNIEWLNLSKYEEELKKIENERKAKLEKKNMLEKALNKLKEYLSKFKKEKKNDLVKQIEADIKKVEKDLASL